MPIPSSDLVTVPREVLESEAIQAALNREAANVAINEVLGFVESWVSNPVSTYSVYALDGLFARTREKIAAARLALSSRLAPPPSSDPEGGARGVQGSIATKRATDLEGDSHTEFFSLQEANIARQKEWDPDNRITLAYRGNELAGEVGEACNVIKKLERERLGINGSRDTIEHLLEELADSVICSYLVAMHVGGGVPLVTLEGRRVANTAIPDMPNQWDHLKKQAVIDAAFIANAWNCFDDLWNALEQCRSPIAALASIGSEQCKLLLPQIDATLAAAKKRGCTDCDYGICTMNCGQSSGEQT